MKLIDFLKILCGDTFITLGVTMCGIPFEARRTAGYFIDHGEELHCRGIKTVYVADGELHAVIQG